MASASASTADWPSTPSGSAPDWPSGAPAGGAGEPWYVAAKDGARNVLVVVQRSGTCICRPPAVDTLAPNWLAQPPSGPFRATVRLRHRQVPQPANVHPLPDAVRIDFDQPQRAATVGQFAVIYQQERCLGGAAIAHAYPIESAGCAESLHTGSVATPI